MDPARRDGEHLPAISVTVWNRPEGHRIDIQYITWSPTDARDGDVYDVTLIDAEGVRTTLIHYAVSYTVSFPNGKDCGPECRTAYVDQSS